MCFVIYSIIDHQQSIIDVRQATGYLYLKNRTGPPGATWLKLALHPFAPQKPCPAFHATRPKTPSITFHHLQLQPRRPEDAPKRLQDGPRRAQSEPKTVQDDTKAAKDEDAQRRAQNAPKRPVSNFGIVFAIPIQIFRKLAKNSRDLAKNRRESKNKNKALPRKTPDFTVQACETSSRSRSARTPIT